LPAQGAPGHGQQLIPVLELGPLLNEIRRHHRNVIFLGFDDHGKVV